MISFVFMLERPRLLRELAAGCLKEMLAAGRVLCGENGSAGALGNRFWEQLYMKKQFTGSWIC